MNSHINNTVYINSQIEQNKYNVYSIVCSQNKNIICPNVQYVLENVDISFTLGCKVSYSFNL